MTDDQDKSDKMETTQKNTDDSAEDDDDGGGSDTDDSYFAPNKNPKPSTDVTMPTMSNILFSMCCL